MSTMLDVGLGYHGETGSCRGCSGFGVMEGGTNELPTTSWLNTHKYPSLLKLFLYVLGKNVAPGNAGADPFVMQPVP